MAKTSEMSKNIFFFYERKGRVGVTMCLVAFPYPYLTRFSSYLFLKNILRLCNSAQMLLHLIQ